MLKKVFLLSIFCLSFIFLSNTASAVTEYPLEVTYPQGGEKFISGQKINITWRYNLPLENIKEISFDYANSHTSGYMGISAAKEEITAGSYQWTVPNDANGDTIFKISVFYIDEEGGFHNKQMVSKTFKVDQNMVITFDSPKENAVFNTGVEAPFIYTITNNSAGLIPGISLYKGDRIVEDNIYITGTNKFFPPTEYGAGSDYRLKIVIGSTEAFSPYFTINIPESQIVKPLTVNTNLSNKYVVGKSYALTWDSSCTGGIVMAWFGLRLDDADKTEVLSALTDLYISLPTIGVGRDSTNIFSGPWQFNNMTTKNEGKIIFTVPPKLNISSFSYNTGKRYVYTITRSSKVKYSVVQSFTHPDDIIVYPGKYFIRVDVGGNNCSATGVSRDFDVVPEGQSADEGVSIDQGTTVPVVNNDKKDSINVPASVNKNSPPPVIDMNFSKKLSGKILLQVQASGAAWYVDPSNNKRYSLGRPEEAFTVMRQRGVGISNTDLNKIPVAIDSLNLGSLDSDNDGYSDQVELRGGYNPNGAGKLKLDNSFTGKQKGKILLQVQSKGQAWYVNPGDNKRYYLGRPVDAFKVMKKLGLGIANNDIEKITSN